MKDLQLKLAGKFGAFLAFILAILMTLFPTEKHLMVIRQGAENSSGVYAPVIVDAIESKDVAALKSLMCANIKNNVPNLDQEIQNFYECIEGDITNISYDLSGDTSMSRAKGQIHQSSIQIHVYTTVKHYLIVVLWEDINNMKPEETKIRSIRISEWIDNVDKTMTATIIYRIQATEGVGEWHE